MRNVKSEAETIFFSGAAAAFLLLALASVWLHTHHVFPNDRIQYAVTRLPAALLSVALFTALVALLQSRFERITSWQRIPSSRFVAAIALLFGIFWLPVLLSSGFVQDDWMLLAGAAVRKIIYLHPQLSWQTLDTVDGNFRPLGTVLYAGYMLPLFGSHPLAFLAGNFTVGLLGSIAAFFIVRELGYSNVAAAAASVLYLSRGLIYTEVAWMSALGDGLVILLCGLTALFTLRAIKRTTLVALPFHFLAWVCFCLAMLAKQSAFATPAIVAALLFLRPGVASSVSLSRPRRVTETFIFFVYAGSAAFIFHHASALLKTHTPYPLSLTFAGLRNLFAYIAWYFATLQIPDQYPAHKSLPSVIGFALLIALVALVRRVPAVLGHRPKDVVFALLAALASLALLLPLGARIAPYYGSMFAFWISIALGIALTRFGARGPGHTPARLACFLFCLLVTVGFLDVRLKQTAIIPAGGYIWGTFGMDREQARYRQLAKLLEHSPQSDTLVLVDFPTQPSYYASMTLLADPALERILILESKANTWRVNDRGGWRPENQPSALSDAGAFNWTVPFDQASALKAISSGKLLWLQFTPDGIRELPARPVHGQ